jgi:3-hydroxymyristoyl/3-hydroxydecanoyl-(acyl carrier protein) dehydratase
MRADSGDTSSSTARLPVLNGREPLPDGVRLHLTTPPGLTWFEGHFPSRPVLPGVAQLAWAITYSREHFGFDHDPVGVDRVKFLATVPLDKPLMLDLHREQNRVNWQLLADDIPLSQGRLAFRAR